MEKGGVVIASMPYYMIRRYGMHIITMPKLTQTMGPWIKQSQTKSANKRLSYEKKVMTALIDQLPNYDYFLQNWSYNYSNWLPFYWREFQQTTLYTYVIEDLTDLDKVFLQFSHAKRKNLKKAEAEVEVRSDLSARDFYENHKMTLSKEGTVISYDFS
ncbi:methicillin resistance protein, partial [bacterium]|nr:methicillin resistance protein [bacterium]